jgi:hypothetical protein
MMDNRIERYREYRSEGQELNEKLLDTLTDDELMEAARFLGMTEEEDGEEVLYHEDELDMPIHSDFAIHELERDGTTALEQFYQSERWETEIEREILEALQGSYTSLFRVEDVRPNDRALVLHDVLGQGNSPIELTDLKLGQTANTDAVIFFRAVPLPEMNISSGFILPFESEYKDHLTSVNQKVMSETESRPESVRRFYAFYRMYQKYGSIGLPS